MARLALSEITSGQNVSKGLLKLHVPLQAVSGPYGEVGFLCGEKNEVISKNGIFFEAEK